jgi:hypothetical protein
MLKICFIIHLYCSWLFVTAFAIVSFKFIYIKEQIKISSNFILKLKSIIKMILTNVTQRVSIRNRILKQSRKFQFVT